jgi:glutamyl-tRNA reductase
MALAAGSARAVLSALFRAAIHTGKRVQTETTLSHASPNLSAAAVRRASQMIDDFAACDVLVVGAGKMARLALESLSKAGARQVTVTNRTFAAAQELSARWNYTAARFDRLSDLVADASAVFTLTSARQPVLSGELIANAVARRPERPLLLVDLGVPGNVDPAARRLAGVQLANLDDLQANSGGAAEGQDEDLTKGQDDAIAAAQDIVRDEARGFENWLEIMPVINGLHKKAEAIRQREVARTLRHLPDADPRLYELFEVFSQSLVDKLLHDPTMRLRKGRGPSVKKYSHALEVLFDLPDEAQPDEKRSSDL